MIKTKSKILLLIMIIISGCSETSIIGNDFVEDDNFDLSFVDTISMDLRTVRFDSLPTSESGRLLIGSRVGTELGDVSSEAYFLLTYDKSTLPTIEEIHQYDSLTLSLPMDGYTLYLDEEGVNQTIIVEQLSSELEFRDDGKLYNTSQVEDSVNLELLGSKEFYWASDRIREVEIRLGGESKLDNKLGSDLFNKMKNADEIFSVTNEFKEYLRGIRIRFENGDAPFIGFESDSLRMTLHYTDNTTSPPANLTYDFKIESSPYYSKIDHTNIRGGLDIIESIEDEIYSDSTDNLSFVSGGLGYAVNIDLDNVRTLLLDDRDFILVDAELQLEWLEPIHEVAPEKLQVKFIDEFYTNSGGSSLFLELSRDDEYDRDNYYTMNVTSLINQLLQPLSQEDRNLLITLEDYNSSVTSVILGDQSFNSVLILYTISIK